MTNPYGNFDKDGMPIAGNNSWNTPAAPQPSGNPQGNQPHYQQPQGFQQGFQQPQSYVQPGVSTGYNSPVNFANSGVPVRAESPKSKLVAILLAFFLGNWGVHNFYTGHTNRAVVQLVMGIIGWGTSAILLGFLVLIPLWIWVFIEFIMLIVGSGEYKYDSEGRVLS